MITTHICNHLLIKKKKKIKYSIIFHSGFFAYVLNQIQLCHTDFCCFLLELHQSVDQQKIIT